jgi:hypothetical protein
VPVIYISPTAYLYELRDNNKTIIYDRKMDFFSKDSKGNISNLKTGYAINKETFVENRAKIENKAKLNKEEQELLNKEWNTVINKVKNIDITESSISTKAYTPYSAYVDGYVQDFSWYRICATTANTMAIDYYARYYDPQLFAPTSYSNVYPHSRKINDYMYDSPYPYYGGVGHPFDRMELAYTSYINNESDISYTVLSNTSTDQSVIFQDYKEHIHYDKQPVLLVYEWLDDESNEWKAHGVCGYGYTGSYYLTRDTYTNDGMLNRPYLWNHAGRFHKIFAIDASDTSWRTSTLRYGSNNINVKRLEIFLKALNYNPGTINNIFDSNTRSAVKAFQSHFGLTSDGVVGTGTYNALINAHRFSKKSRTLKYGRKGDDVAELQARLNCFGYNCGTADGQFGSATKIAVKNFQSAKGLTSDGIVGAGTYAKLID